MTEKAIVKKAKVVRDTFIRTELNYIDHPQAQRWMHYHDECELMMILAGNGDFIYNNRHYPAKKGSLFVINPSVPHRIDMMQSPSHQRIVIEFDGNYTDQMTKEIAGFGTFDFFEAYQGVYQLEDPAYSEIKDSLVRVVDEQINHRTHYLELMTCDLIDAFLRISRSVRRKRSHRASSPESLVKSAEDYIVRHLTENLSLTSLSTQLFVTREYLSRVFKKYRGITVQEYINLTKCRAAKELLNSTAEPIAMIANHFGYRSAAYFSTVFKKQTGMTPREYRADVRATDQLENDYNNRNYKSKQLLADYRRK